MQISCRLTGDVSEREKEGFCCKKLQLQLKLVAEHCWRGRNMQKGRKCYSLSRKYWFLYILIRCNNCWTCKAWLILSYAYLFGFDLPIWYIKFRFSTHAANVLGNFVGAGMDSTCLKGKLLSTTQDSVKIFLSCGLRNITMFHITCNIIYMHSSFCFISLSSKNSEA